MKMNLNIKLEEGMAVITCVQGCKKATVVLDSDTYAEKLATCKNVNDVAALF